MTGLAALTERIVLSARLDLMFAVIAPVVGFIGVVLVLQNIIDTGGMSYAQYVLPAIVVQAMLFGAMTTTDRAAHEQSSGFGLRLRTLPIAVMAPLTARMLYCLIRGVLALVAAVAIAYLFGFRLSGGLGYAAAFVVLPLVLTLALSLGADATGTVAKRVGNASQLLQIPQLLLVLLSTGLAPVDAFPGWVQPFVKYQPVSQVTDTLRNFANGEVVTSNLVTSTAWCIGLLVVFGVLAVRMQRRTE
ncbi:ABC transporter permease [Mycobacterium deserti]|uniref:ABC transporter permease n=1 Tax=Mycobacterium deserti TaxID=2978347 RepID=A0ABT2M527_9MYCO|nr:ABC transporter permease [Mycobacterium deserti]MCT7657359.1 ABC transporter permease [Mycobacterium deserti]